MTKELQLIHLAPRPGDPLPDGRGMHDGWIMIHDGGWIDPATGEEVLGDAVARWRFNGWEMRDVLGGVYLGPTWWSDAAGVT